MREGGEIAHLIGRHGIPGHAPLTAADVGDVVSADALSVGVDLHGVELRGDALERCVGDEIS
jgi:hypothetical protein